MHRRVVGGLIAVAISFAIQACPAAADQMRIALVIGNSAYEKGPLETALNDAGLVAEALNSAGFEVFTGADLHQSELRMAFHEFIAAVEAAGPEVDAFVYFAGYGLEFDGENYLLPIGVRLEQVSDIPIEAVRLADLVRRLSGTANGTKVVVLDAARSLPFPLEGGSIAPGLAAVDAQPGLLLAMSCEPGTIAANGPGHYGPYAMAIAEMLSNPTRQVDLTFTMIRKRTYRATQGQQKPWHVSGLTSENDFFHIPGIPIGQGVVSPQPPVEELSADAAFAAAIAADTLSAYVNYVEAYPSSPYAGRIWETIRTRREALTWLSATELNTAEAYWTYLAHYPDGVHAGASARRLQRISAKFEPRQGFKPLDFSDVPPPLAEESLKFPIAPAQPVPEMLIALPPALFANLPSPSPPSQTGELPSPGPLPLVSVRERPPLRPVLLTPPYHGAVAASSTPKDLARERTSTQKNGVSASRWPGQPQAGKDSTSQTTLLDQEPLPPLQRPLQSPSPVPAVQANPLPTVPMPHARPRGSLVRVAAVASPRMPRAPQAPTAKPAARLWPFSLLDRR